MITQLSEIAALIQPGQTPEQAVSLIEVNVQRLFEEHGLSLGGQVGLDDLDAELQRAIAEFNYRNGGKELAAQREEFEASIGQLRECFLNVL